MDDSISVSQQDLRKLLSAASGDAALLWLYGLSGGDLSRAGAALRMPQHRVDTASAALRQLGLWQDQPSRSFPVPSEAPHYTEDDVARAIQQEQDFGPLRDEIQKRLGRVLSVEELKILLSMRNYLGLPAEVICLLLTFCMERNRARGNPRPPSFRQLEKTACQWADEGIDTLEAASAHMQLQLERQCRIGPIRRLLQIGDRRLTAPEEKYVLSWIDMGFPDESISMAYERTCVNTGRFSWQYINTILKSWHSQGLHQPDEIRVGDSRPSGGRKPDWKKPKNPQTPPGDPNEIERLALERMLSGENS